MWSLEMLLEHRAAHRSLQPLRLMRASSFAAGVIALFGTTSVASAQASPPTAIRASCGGRDALQNHPLDPQHERDELRGKHRSRCRPGTWTIHWLAIDGEGLHRQVQLSRCDTARYSGSDGEQLGAQRRSAIRLLMSSARSAPDASILGEQRCALGC